MERLQCIMLLDTDLTDIINRFNNFLRRDKVQGAKSWKPARCLQGTWVTSQRLSCDISDCFRHDHQLTNETHFLLRHFLASCKVWLVIATTPAHLPATGGRTGWGWGRSWGSQSRGLLCKHDSEFSGSKDYHSLQKRDLYIFHVTWDVTYFTYHTWFDCVLSYI